MVHAATTHAYRQCQHPEAYNDQQHIPSNYRTCDRRTAPDILAAKTSVILWVRQRGRGIYLNETLYPLLDVQRVRLEATRKLPRHLVDKVVMRHVLAVLHDPHNARLPIQKFNR